MSFILAGAVSGLGSGIQKFADEKRKEIAAQKARQDKMDDAKELYDYKLGRKAGAASSGGRSGSSGGKGGPSGGGAGVATLTDDERDFVLAQNGFDWEVDKGDPMVSELILAGERIKGEAGGKISPGLLAKRVSPLVRRSDERVDGGFMGTDTINKGAGPIIGVEGNDPRGVAPNPLNQAGKPPAAPAAPSAPSGSGFNAAMGDQSPSRPSAPSMPASGGFNGIVNSAPAASPAQPEPDAAKIIAAGQQAIDKGASVEAVRARLKSMGIDPTTVQ